MSQLEKLVTQESNYQLMDLLSWYMLSKAAVEEEMATFQKLQKTRTRHYLTFHLRSQK